MFVKGIIKSKLYALNPYPKKEIYIFVVPVIIYLVFLFTNSAPLGRVGHRVAMSVCVSVPSQNNHFRRSCRPLVEDRVPNIGVG